MNQCVASALYVVVVVVVVVVFSGLVMELRGRDGPLSKTGPRLIDGILVSAFRVTCKTGF